MSRSDIQQRYFGCSERVYRRVVNQLVDMDLIEKIDNQLQLKYVDKFIERLNY